MNPPNTLPQLILLKQTNQGEEKFLRNGISQNAHVVIKNTPFVLQLGLLNPVLFNHIFNFNQFTLEAKLFYDTDSAKEVDFVKVKPLEFKTHLSERGEQCTLEGRIKVLSSQHEDLFFKIKVIALDSRTGQEFCPSLCVFSQPIKVISKPEKVVKNNSLKKRNFTDMLLDTVQRLEKQQKEQQQQIVKLFELQAAQTPQPSLTLSSSSVSTFNPGKKEEETPDFEQSFKRMLEVFATIPTDEKAPKLRKVTRSLTPSETQSLIQFVDLVGSEGLIRDASGDNSVRESEDHHHHKGSCDCTNCHYKDELLRIDDFYRDFLGTA